MSDAAGSDAVRSDPDHRRTSTWVGAATDLAQTLREALDALVTTDLPAEQLADLAAQVGWVLEPLAARSRPQPVIRTEHLRGDLPHSPVVGQLSPTAIPMVIESAPDGLESRLTVPQRFEGPPGLVHGGYSAMLLDEILGQLAIGLDSWMLTARLEVRYRRPIPLGIELILRARVDNRDGRRATLRGTIATAAEPDLVCVEAVGGFTEPRPEARQALFGSNA